MSEETPSTPLDPTPVLPRPEAYPPPPPDHPIYQAAPPPRRTRSGLVIGVISAIAVLVVAAIAIGVVFVGVNVLRRTNHTTGPVDVSTVVTSTSGKTVFSDDFHDPTSGWTTNALPSGTTFKYAAGTYVVVAKGSLDHFAGSPYSTPVAQIAISVTATQSTDSPVAAGYGVSCWRGLDQAELRYDFLLRSGGDWTVDRRDGGVLTKALILKQGTSSATLGGPPLAVEGMCATLADGHTVRLLMFAGAQKLADITDNAAALPDAGWQADLVLTSSASHDSTVTVTRFEVRDLAR